MLFRILRMLFRLLWRVEVRGDLSVLYQPRVIITPNHPSFIDAVLLALFLPVRPVIIVYRHISESWYIRLLSFLVDLVPLDFSQPISVKQIIRLVEQGRPVLLFPEGRVTLTGSLMKIYNGAGFIAAKSQASIVPVRIDGAQFTPFSRLPLEVKRRRFPRITITVLPATTISASATMSASETRALAAEQLDQIMREAQVAARRRETLYEAFLHSRQCYGGSTSWIEDSQQRYTYNQLLRQALHFAALLERYSQPGEVIGLLLPGEIRSVALLLGALLRGRVPALLNPELSSAALNSALTVSQINTVFTLGQAAPDTSLTKPVIWYNLDKLSPPSTLTETARLTRQQLLPRLAAYPRAPEEAALVLFTDEKDGPISAVTHTHKSLLANVEQVRAVTDWSPQDKIMSVLPLADATGLVLGVLTPLLSGANVFLYPHPHHYRIIPELIYDRSCTLLLGQPAWLERYGQAASVTDVVRLRYVIATHERLPATLRQDFLEKFALRIVESYGNDAWAPVVALNVPQAARPGTVGRLLPGIQAQLLAEPDVQEGGRLQLASPGVVPRTSAGEQIPPVSSSQTLIWHDTGELAHIDSDGYCQIIGRAIPLTASLGEKAS